MRKLAAAALTVALGSPTAGIAGTVSGKVVLVQDGNPRADASNVVVWIEGGRRPVTPGVTREPDSAKGAMRSASKRFQPRVVAVSRTATVEFPNSDPIYHNVFSVSGVNRFDLGLYRSGASKSKTFEDPGLVRVYCNIHPQMVGFVMVVDSDFVAVTGPDGTFRFEGVPPGSHSVRAWQEEGRAEASQPVTVRSGADPPIALMIDVSGYKAPPHKNKYGKDYAPRAGESDDERY